MSTYVVMSTRVSGGARIVDMYDGEDALARARREVAALNAQISITGARYWAGEITEVPDEPRAYETARRDAPVVADRLDDRAVELRATPPGPGYSGKIDVVLELERLAAELRGEPDRWVIVSDGHGGKRLAAENDVDLTTTGPAQPLRRADRKPTRAPRLESVRKVPDERV